SIGGSSWRVLNRVRKNWFHLNRQLSTWLDPLTYVPKDHGYRHLSWNLRSGSRKQESAIPHSYSSRISPSGITGFRSETYDFPSVECYGRLERDRRICRDDRKSVV